MSNHLPLSGVRVLDLTQVYAGPTCTRLLSDLGADVIKVEGLKRIDITRNFVIADNNSQGDYWNRAGYFLYRNGGKRSLTLDFNDPEAVEIVKRLVPHADVVAESFTPRVMAKFGLEYESLRRIRPDLIMISLSGYGQTGPWHDYSAYGMGLEPASGISSLTGYRNGDPQRTGISFTDPYSGIAGAGAVLAALVHRRRTGKGQYIDLSEQEAAIPVVGYALMDYAMNGRLPERIGNRSPIGAAPQGVYRCAGDDRWIAISIAGDEEWAAFCAATGHSEWAQDERFDNVLGRRANIDALDKLIESWTSAQDHYDAFHLLQRAGVTAAPVLDGKEVYLDPQFRERGQFDLVEQEHMGRRLVGRHLAARFADTSTSPGRSFAPDAAGPAPTFGEHNHEVLSSLLGMSDAEIAELEEQKVIATRPNIPFPPQLITAALKLPYDKYLELGILQAIEEDYKQQLGLA